MKELAHTQRPHARTIEKLGDFLSLCKPACYTSVSALPDFTIIRNNDL
jgi:hypothetical protein